MTSLQFEATLGGVTIKPGKPPDDYGRSTPGGFTLTLNITQPQPPKRPGIPGHFSVDYRGLEWGPRPQPPTRKNRGENDEAFEARKKDAIAQGERYDAEKANYDSERLPAYEAALSRHRELTMAYAQLIGIASVFGSQVMTCTLEPANQDLLPGFSASLLGPGE